MHQALRIAEILENVFQRLDKSSQAAALRTCRSWFPPAAQALWHTGAEKGFRYLVESCEHVVSRSITFEDMVACKKWKRFQLYSSLIRSLYLYRLVYSLTGASATFFDKMVEYSHAIKTTPLLPRLIKLGVEPSRAFKLDWVRIFFCPSLVSFAVLFGSGRGELDTTDQAAFLECLWKELPALNHASFLMRGPVVQTLKATCIKLEHLRSLECTSAFVFGRGGLESLAQLPKLLELAILGNNLLSTLEGQAQSLADWPEFPALCPELRRIRLCQIDLVIAARFLDECLPSTLQDIDIETNSNDISHFVSACARCKTLQSFRLRRSGSMVFSDMSDYSQWYAPRAVPDQPLDLDWLSGLAECKGLKMVRVEWARPGVVCTVTDDPLILFAKSWPQIESFELLAFKTNIVWPGLDTRKELYSAGTVTQKSLLAFGTHCRRLRELSLPHLTMDASTDYTIPSPSWALTSLSIHRMRGNLGRALDLISQVWPNTRCYSEDGVMVSRLSYIMLRLPMIAQRREAVEEMCVNNEPENRDVTDGMTIESSR